jgi:double-stranded uracil-DNA glycosylase
LTDLRRTPPVHIPLALWRLHRATAVGDTVRVRFPATVDAGLLLEGGGFAPDGTRLRTLADCVGPGLRLLICGLNPSLYAADAGDHPHARLTARATRARTLPDTVGPGMRLLLCGLNPSLYAADAGIGFARPGNRFWPALLAAGLATVDRDPLALLTGQLIGMTDLVKRATVSASELAVDEYVHGVSRLDRLVAWLQPDAVCFLGFDGWRKAVDRAASAGWQERPLGGRPVYVMPNPSGLNAHTNMADLAAHFATVVSSPPWP